MPNLKRPGGGVGSATPWPGPGKPQSLRITSRYSSAIVLPDIVPGTLYGPETFTGTNGAALPAPWSAGLTPSGGGASIQGNAARLVTGTTGGYAPASRVSRYLSTLSLINAVPACRFRMNAECYPRLYVRSTNTALDGEGGYYVEYNPGVNKCIMSWGLSFAGPSTPLAEMPFSFSFNTWYWTRFGVIGSQLKFRIWPDGATEPSNWDLEAADLTHTGAGRIGWTVGSGNIGLAQFEFDDFSVYDNFGPNIANNFEGWGTAL